MRQGEIVSVHLDSVTYDEVNHQIWLPADITKAKKGRFVPLTAEGAFEAYQRLVLHIGRQYTPQRFYSRWWNAKEEALGTPWADVPVRTAGSSSTQHDTRQQHGWRNLM